MTRFKEHNDPKKTSAVIDHMIKFNHSVLFDDVKVITSGNNDKELLIKESLTVKRMKPIMNNNVKSFPLELF